MTKPQRTGNRVRLTETRHVPVSPTEAFAYTADFSNIEEWDPGVARSKRFDESRLGVGSRFELDVTFGSSVVPMTYEITVYEPDERVVLEGRGGKIIAVDDIRFTADGEGTRIDYTADLTFNNFIRFLLPFMSGRMEQVGTKALDGLEECLSR